MNNNFIRYRILKGVDKGKIEEIYGLNDIVDPHSAFFTVNKLSSADVFDKLCQRGITWREFYENLSREGLIKILDSNINKKP